MLLAHPNMLELFMKHDILSIEFTDLDVPSHFVNEMEKLVYC